MKKLGQHLRIQGADVISQLSDEIGKNYHYGLAICFSKKGKYSGISLTKGKRRIIFKDIHAKKPPFTFVLRYTPKINNLLTRMCNNAKGIINWGENRNIKSITFFQDLLGEVEKNVLTIVEDIQNGYPPDASPKQKVFLYWALLEDDGRIIPLCSKDIVIEYFSEEVLEDYAFQKSATKIKMVKKASPCSVCGCTKQNVYGNFSEIACYNLDKPGMIAGGFGYNQTARNFPVCKDCIFDILGAKTFIETNLQFYLAGLNYWIIPEAMDNDVYQELLNDISEQKTRQTLGRELKTITNKEEEIFDYIVHKAKKVGTLDPITLNLFFFRSSKASWRMIAEMRRVLPTRLRDIFNAKNAVQKRPEMLISKKDEKNGYIFTLNNLKPICGDSEKISERRFLSYVDAVFKGKRLHWRNVVSDIAHCIVSTQKSKPEMARFRVRDAWAIYNFFKELRIIEMKEGGDKMPKQRESENKYSVFMNENSEFFGNVARKASFLTGAYVGAVLYAQYKIRKSQPFSKKFFGRKLSKDRLVYLFNEAKKKLTQYDKLGLVYELEPLLAKTWVEVADDWPLSKEDTTFAFNLGCTLASKLKKPDDEDNKNNIMEDTA